jgi:hypothetical protein
LIDDLFAMEVQRVVLNMQISLLHTLRRQALDCASKLDHAHTVYQRRNGAAASPPAINGAPRA